MLPPVVTFLLFVCFFVTTCGNVTTADMVTKELHLSVLFSFIRPRTPQNPTAEQES